ncbi:MAG: flagellar hook-associated protein FlgL, partial [Burkholderiaceae bacterium]
PFAQSATGATYLGDQGPRMLQVGPSQQLDVSDSGNAVFERNKTGNGTFSTAASGSNTGSGIVSSGSVVNSAALTGDQYSITFSAPSATTVTANPANTGTLVIGSSIANASALTGSNYRIDYDSTTANYSITRLSDNVVVYPANATFPPASPIDGLNFSSVSGTPPVAGTDSFLVQPQITSYSIVDTTTSTTLSTGNPYTPGQSIAFGGLQFNVTGTPANGDQFTVKPSTNQSIFTTLKNLIGVLNTPAVGSVAQAALTNGLSVANDNIGHALDNVLTVRATIGSRLNTIDDLDSNGTDKDLQYSQTLSQLQDLDYTKAVTQLTQQQTTLTAAQQSFVKISGLSLFNYL